jgi:excisionase family DNA binding protein
MNNVASRVIACDLAARLAPALQTFIDTFSPYASIKDLSAFLKIPYGTIHTWVATGKIPCTKVAGQDPKIYLSDLKTFVAEHGKEATLAD